MGCVGMVINDIEKLRSELYYLIDSNHSYDEIYKVSVELDKLILEFYKTKQQN